jgi:hypothetical protein
MCGIFLALTIITSALCKEGSHNWCTILECLVTKFENPSFKLFGKGSSDIIYEGNPLWVWNSSNTKRFYLASKRNWCKLMRSRLCCLHILTHLFCDWYYRTVSWWSTFTEACYFLWHCHKRTQNIYELQFVLTMLLLQSYIFLTYYLYYYVHHGLESIYCYMYVYFKLEILNLAY